MILNYQNWEVTLRCIDSIYAYVNDIEFEIIVVDNGSTTETPEKIKEYESCGNFSILFNSVNLGYAAGNNVGIAKAKELGCSHILITNSDVIFKKNSVEELVAEIDLDPSLGIIAPKEINLDGTEFIPGVVNCITLREKYICDTFLKGILKKEYKNYINSRQIKTGKYVFTVGGCCFMMTKKCADLITPLDENTFLFHEELIIGKRLEQVGLKASYTQKSEIVHGHGESTKTVKAFSYIKYIESELYFCRRYLGASNLALYPLIVIRKLSYIKGMVKYQDFRQPENREMLKRDIKKVMKEKW